MLPTDSGAVVLTRKAKGVAGGAHYFFWLGEGRAYPIDETASRPQLI